MKRIIALLLICLLSMAVFAQKVETSQDSNGWRLLVNGKPFEIKGMVWAYTPIGETHTYDLWSKSDDYIMKMIDTDMVLLQKMGVNTIRCFSTIPPRWVEYIYSKYSIYTMVNDLLGRYGVTVNGKWHASTDYSDIYTRETLVEQARQAARMYKDVPGVLMYMFGNESNYGLVWSGSDIENLPTGEQDGVKAGYLYSLLEEAMAACKEIDPDKPVGIVNGDTQNLDIIAELCPTLDILGINAYRGYRFYDSFYENIADVLDKPIILTEAGADAFDALKRQEDQHAQAEYLRAQWEEIYQQAYGKGKTGNILGGYVFEWIDEWWKHYQNKNLTIHDEIGTWANAGYDKDFRTGVDNMNEEWFGICGQSTITDQGIHKRIPRAAYYLLTDIWKLSLYDSSNSDIDKTFASLDMGLYVALGNETSVKEMLNEQSLLTLSSLSVNAEVYQALDHSKVTELIESGRRPSDIFAPQTRAETTIAFNFKPVENLEANASIKMWTDSPYTHFDEEWPLYQKKNAALYSASFNYTQNMFDLNGYWHEGHASYETTGDMFNISKEAFDIIGYNTFSPKAPIALEFIGKGFLSGLQVIGGPEIWGGAAPQVIANYYREIPTASVFLPNFTVGAVWAEDLSAAQPAKDNPYGTYGAGRRISLVGTAHMYPYFTAKLGVLHSGAEKINAWYETQGGYRPVAVLDTFGFQAELGTEILRYTYLYSQFIWRGRVAETNAAEVRGSFFTDDSGSGNRMEIRLGGDVAVGDFSIKSIVRARVPLEAPAGRSLTDAYSAPFFVYGNRQALEAEAVLTYDTEGATWFHDWNIDDIEGSKLAGSLSAMYTLYAGPTDCMPFKLATGTWTSFPKGLDVQEHLWLARAKVISSPIPDFKIIGSVAGGRQGSTGEDREIITFAEASLGLRWHTLMFKGDLAYNKWGPQAWWRTFNLRFPWQWSADLSYGFSVPSFVEKTNSVGIKWEGRQFGANSDDPYRAITSTGPLEGKVFSQITCYVKLSL